MNSRDIFALPVMDKFLIYAPFHNVSALVNRGAALEIWSALCAKGCSTSTSVQRLIAQLATPGDPVPRIRSGPVTEPLFLGLITTRGCNMGCIYCNFAAQEISLAPMDLAVAREAVNTYMELLVKNSRRDARIQFFGGEPFHVEQVVHFVTNYATFRAAQLGLNVSFEAISNGLHGEERARWIADHFDTIVLSLDGPADIQNRNRPSPSSQPTFDVVVRTGKILSEGLSELIVRSCITKDSVPRLPQIAEWLVREFRISTWCAEPLTTSPLAREAGLEVPDPWEFARSFEMASRILAKYGVKAVNSTTEMCSPRITCCPVAQDALIVSPDGSLAACYLLEEDWACKGLDLRFGHLSGVGAWQTQAFPGKPALEIDDDALQRVRRLNVNNRPLCLDCMCRYSCAGGCWVYHDLSASPCNNDGLCIYTRLITAANLLRNMGQSELVTTWFSDRAAMEVTALRTTDRLDALESLQ